MQSTDAQLLAALERFVVDNDDLLELEARIGRFNIFDALGVVRAEIRHSNFLAWLLDPNESHGAGHTFLNAVLMDLLRESPVDLRPLSPVDLDGSSLGGVKVRREYRNIDLLISSGSPRIVVAVENKIDSGEHSDQLQRYRAIVQQDFPEHKPLFVFLTPDGDEPTEADWVSYTYGDIHRVLKRAIRLFDEGIGDEVKTFLDHYLTMIGSRLMPDPDIDALCERIYKNHRQAIDLILERFGDPRAEFIRRVGKYLEERPDSWAIYQETSTVIRFMPAEWRNSILDAQSGSDRPTLHALIRFNPRVAFLRIVLEPLSDEQLHEDLIEEISKRGDTFGFSPNRSLRPKRRNAVWAQTLARDRGGLDPNDNLLETALEEIDRLYDRLKKMESFVRPFIESAGTERDE